MNAIAPGPVKSNALTLGEIVEIIEDQAIQNALNFNSNTTYETYFAAEIQSGTEPRDILSPDRFGFIRRNINADVRPHLNSLVLPVLTISGADDLNVEMDETVQIYFDTVGKQNALSRVLKIDGATHALFDARYFNYQLTENWPRHTYYRFLFSGRAAYAPGVLE